MLGKPLVEKKQYASLAEYLEALGCKHVWRDGHGHRLKLDVKEPQFRRPDVVGAQHSGGVWRVYLIEAKKDTGGGASVQSCPTRDTSGSETARGTSSRPACSSC